MLDFHCYSSFSLLYISKGEWVLQLRKTLTTLEVPIQPISEDIKGMAVCLHDFKRGKSQTNMKGKHLLTLGEHF